MLRTVNHARNFFLRRNLLPPRAFLRDFPVGFCLRHAARFVNRTMLRITTIQRADAPVVLKLEGKLLEPWIGELDDACRRATASTATTTLDLSGVSYVDVPGAIALRNLRRRGVQLVGGSPLVTELLKEGK